jgi:hypothetical protein
MKKKKKKQDSQQAMKGYRGTVNVYFLTKGASLKRGMLYDSSYRTSIREKKPGGKERPRGRAQGTGTTEIICTGMFNVIFHELRFWFCV